MPSISEITVQQVRDALGDLDHDSVAEGPILVEEANAAVRLILGPLAKLGEPLAGPAAYRRAPERQVAQDAADRLSTAGLTVDADALAAGYRVKVTNA